MKIVKIFKVLAIIAAAFITIMLCTATVTCWDIFVLSLKDFTIYPDLDTAMLSFVGGVTSLYLTIKASKLSEWIICDT